MQPSFRQNYVVSSGVTSSGLTLGFLDTITVLSGGTMSAIQLSDGGFATVSSGGSAFFDTIASGGVEDILSGGVASGEVVLSSGVVEGGGELVGATISGAVSGVVLLGDDTIASGGVFASATVGEFADATVAFGATVSDVTVSGLFASLGLSPDTDVSSVTIESGGALFAANSEADASVVAGGGLLDVTGSGVMIGTTILAGGEAALNAPFFSDQSTTVSSGGLFLANAGLGMSDVISSGGLAIASGAGLLDPTLVGGVLSMISGTVTEATVSSGGREVVLNDGIDSASTVLSGGVMVLSGGAITSGSLVSGGGVLDLLSTFVISGETLVLSAPRAAQTVLNTTIEAGGVVSAQGLIVEAHGVMSLASGAIAEAVTVSSGGQLLGPGALHGEEFTNYDYGLMRGVRLGASVDLKVEAHGVASSVVASGPDTQITVVSGGRAVGVQELAAFDRLSVELGGVATGTLVRAGADIVVFGVASTTHVSSGGMEYVEAGGKTQTAVVMGGGQEEVASGGAAVSAIVSGGLLTVASGGAISGGLTLKGGEVVLSGAAAAGQTLDVVSGVLALADLAAFKAKISGLATAAQQLDLGGFAFSAGETVTWTQAGTSGALTVRDGAQTASLTLIGTYVTSDFHLATDSHGGTYVTDPKTAPAFVQAAAAMAPRAGVGPSAIVSGAMSAALLEIHATASVGRG
jgi:autotransporter passenger strand-loop-strand repeat protein